MTNSSFSSHDILRQLNDCAIVFNFPMLDNGYVYPCDAALHAYADSQHWAIIIECLGFHIRAGGHDGIQNTLYCFGNCLVGKPGLGHNNFLFPTSDATDHKTFDDDNWALVNPLCKSICIRDKIVPLDLTPSKLAAKNIQATGNRIGGEILLRSLLPEYREQLIATEEEIKQHLSLDIPCLLTLSKWYHPNVSNGALPADNETFKQLAAILADLDPSIYNPTHEPNTHWSNWPNGGTLIFSVTAKRSF